MTGKDEVHLLSGAYALDAVDQDEARQLEVAMRESEDLHSEVVGLTDTAVALGMALPAQTPPPELRGRLLDLIDATPQLPPEDEAVEHVEVAEPAAEPVALAATMPSGEHVVRRRRRRVRPMAWLAVAAAAVLLFGGGFLVQRTLLQPQSDVATISTAADHREVTAAVTGGGHVEVVWSRSQHRTAVLMNGVSAPSGKVLQLWSIRGGTVTSAGLYQPQGGDNFVVLTGTPSPGERFAVSVEPDGGSAQPTTKPIMDVALRA